MTRGLAIQTATATATIAKTEGPIQQRTPGKCAKITMSANMTIVNGRGARRVVSKRIMPAGPAQKTNTAPAMIALTESTDKDSRARICN